MPTKQQKQLLEAIECFLFFESFLFFHISNTLILIQQVMSC